MSATMQLSDEPGLLQRAVAGDQEAFAGLVREHESLVFSIAYHFFGERDSAEEVAQDVFLQPYRNIDELESDAHVAFWLRRVTANRCIDRARRRRLRAVPLEVVDESHRHETITTSDPFLDRALRALVAALPESQRLILTLRYQEELEPAEIGSTLGMPLNTVKSHLRRALASLRTKLPGARTPQHPENNHVHR